MAEQINQFLPQIFDGVAGTTDTYELVTANAFGDPYTDADVDNVVLVKTAAGQYFRLVHTEIPAEKFGISSANTAAANSDAMDALAAAVPLGSTITFRAETYRFARTVLLVDKKIHFKGNGFRTTWIFPVATKGVFVKRVSGVNDCIFENLLFTVAGPRDPTDGTFVVPDAEKSQFLREQGTGYNSERYRWHGFHTQARCTLINCQAVGFSGSGFVFQGAVGDGTDCSLSYVQNCKAKENGSHGFYCTDYDANQITFVNCDARDHHDGVGFYDNSFLGNHFIGCHGNNNYMGHFIIDNPNAYGTVVSCYGESGQDFKRGGNIQTSYISKSSTRFGGIHANGMGGGGQYAGSEIEGRIRYGNLWLEPGILTFNSRADVAFRLSDVTDGDRTLTHWSMSYGGDGQKNLFDMKSSGVFGDKGEYSDPLGPRNYTNALFHYKYLAVGNRLQASSNGHPNQDSDLRGIQFREGDTVTNLRYNGHNPGAWRCSLGGYGGNLPYTRGLTATRLGVRTVQLSAPTGTQDGDILLGDNIVIGGQKLIVQDFPNPDPTVITTDNVVPILSGMEIHTLEGVKIEGITAEAVFGKPQQLKLSRPLTEFTVGQSFRLVYDRFGQFYVIKIIRFEKDRSVFTTDVDLPQVSNAAITFAKAEFAPTGEGRGTLAQRPDATTGIVPLRLTSTDTGFRYFNTDNNTWTTWTGTAWV